MKKFFLWIWISFFIIAFGICWQFNRCIQDPNMNNETISDYRMVFYDAQVKQPEITSEQDILFDSIDTLNENSILIVKGISDKDRKLRENNILTPVRITKVYKGDSSYYGETIQVFEPISMSKAKNKTTLICNKNYNLMTDGDEYIMFLRKRDFIEGYEQSDETFIFTDELLSKYCTNKKIELLPEEYEEGVSLTDVHDWALLTQDTNILQIYKEFANNVIKTYN